MKVNIFKKTIVYVAAVSTKVSQADFAYRLRAMAIPTIFSVPLRCELKKLCVKDEEALAHAVHSAASSLKKGHVIAVPTDTVYGIAGLAQNSEAVNRLYSIKNRNCSKPIAISVGDIDDLYRWSKVVVPKQILEDLLPGPVTVVFERSPELNPLLNPNTHLVGIRIPDHAFIRNLSRACGSPIALTSANKSSDQSTLSLDCLQEDF
ncbi:hypothetical protein C0Q70_11207 [Pomacea canaliculata]|uniref:Threonylcarbamoyl-AMP synthase n=1 Tax=Pomacea canaliculata TaxID=400727 RepID=A0A2T7P5B4_POMCA|nr:hypothetical protein C0Q70_11207 [Pomacea canaliculata]